MKNYKKIIALCLAGAMLTAGLSACGKKSEDESSTENSDKKVTLTIMRNTPQDLDTQFEKEMIAEFEETHPNVKIDYQQMAYDNYITSLQTKLASGDAVDIFMLETAYIPKYVENGYVADLSDLASVNNFESADLENLSYDGKLYALSFNMTSMCAVYNKDVFEEAGISKVPETLDEFYADCEKIKAAGYEPIANGFKEAWTISGNLQSDYITGVLAEDDNAIKAVCDGSKTFSDNQLWKDEFKRFFDRYKYTNADSFGTDWNNACSMLATGKAGMILNGNWAATNALGINEDANLGVFAMPVSNDAEDTKLLVQGPTVGWAVYKDSKNAEMAKEFVDFMNSIDAANKNVKLTKSITSMKEAEVGDGAAVQDMQAYIDADKVFRQGSIDHNFPNEQREILETTVSQFLLEENYDVDALCGELDEQFVLAAK